MKRLLVVLFTLMSVVVSSQIFNPVEWEFSQKQLSKNEIELQFKASIEYPWHMYSQLVDDDMIATKLTFTTDNSCELLGVTTEGESIEEYDPTQEMVLKYFEHEAVFIQKIKVISSEDFKIAGNVYFMVCDAAKCLPPEEVEFLFEIKGIDGGVTIVSKESAEEKERTSRVRRGLFGVLFCEIGFLFV